MQEPLGPQQQRERSGEGFSLRPQLSAQEIPQRGDILDPQSPAPPPVLRPPALPEEVRLLQEKHAALEEQLWRANQELSRYQARYGEDPGPDEAGDRGFPLDAPPWLTEPGLVSPLLKAYDARIRELTASAARKDTEYKAVQAHMDEILAENELLRKQNEGYLEDMASKGFGAFGPADITAEFQERIDTLLAENGVLLQQNSVLKDEVKRMQRYLVKPALSDFSTEQTYRDERNAEMASLTNVVKEAGEAVKVGEERIKDLDAAREICEEEILSKTQRVAQLESSTASLKKALNEAQRQNKQLVSQVNEYKSALVEKSRVLDSEREALTSKVRTSAERIHELQIKLSSKSEDFEGISKTYRDAKRELDSVRADAEGMLQVITNLERQVEDFTAKESEILQLRKEANSKVEDALLERDRAQALEQQARRELARQADRRRLQLEEYNHELQTEVSKVRASTAKLLADREEEYKSLLEDCATAKTSCELAKEAQRTAERKYADLASEWEKYKNEFEARTTQLEQKLIHTEARADAAEDSLGDRQREVLQLRSDRQELEDKHRGVREVLQRERDVRSREVERLREQFREMSTAQEKSQQESKLYQLKLREMQSRLESTAEEISLRRENEVEDLKLKLQRLGAKLQSLEEKETRVLENHRRELDKAVVEKEQQVRGGCRCDAVIKHDAAPSDPSNAAAAGRGNGDRSQARRAERGARTESKSARSRWTAEVVLVDVLCALLATAVVGDGSSRSAGERAPVRPGRRGGDGGLNSRGGYLSGADALKADLDDAERRTAQLSSQLGESLAEQQKLAKGELDDVRCRPIVEDVHMHVDVGEGRLKAEMSKLRTELHRLEREASGRHQRMLIGAEA
eukprot:scaffold4178_cov257-Pinguiococcus_pyrenoidosus.AAC.4